MWLSDIFRDKAFTKHEQRTGVQVDEESSTNSKIIAFATFRAIILEAIPLGKRKHGCQQIRQINNRIILGYFCT